MPKRDNAEYARALSDHVFSKMEDDYLVSALARVFMAAKVAGETTGLEVLYAATEMRSPAKLRAIIREAVRRVLPEVTNA